MATFATDKDINCKGLPSSDTQLGVSNFSAVARVEDRDIAPGKCPHLQEKLVRVKSMANSWKVDIKNI